MASPFVASKAQLIYALCLPVAVLVGYFLASPTDFSSVAILVAFLSLLVVPVLMKFYHPVLVASWNAAITPYFLPGAPHLWMLLAVVGFGFAVVNRFTNPDAKLVSVPSLNRAMTAMLLVVCITAILRGGIGMRVTGSSSFGGKYYIAVIAGLLGYFALISQRIPRESASTYAALFFLPALTALIPNLTLLAGESLLFLYYLFPAFLAQEQATAMYGPGADFVRFTGLTFASMGFYCWLLSKFGLRGIFDWTKPWRLLLFICAFLACLHTGYRSFLLLFLLTVAIQFVAEGLFRPRIVIPGIVMVSAVAVALLPNAKSLPAVVQRSLSFLPIELSPAIRQSAAASSDWRLRMWAETWPQVPRYALLGKGFTIDPDDLMFAQENIRRGFSPDYTGALVAGDYHNGPLGVIIPFGVWGLLGLGAIFVCGWRYLYAQVKHGDEELQKLNRFLLVFFTARIVYFLLVFGSFPYDLFVFTGILGFSVSLNGPRPEPSEGWSELSGEAAQEVFPRSRVAELLSAEKAVR